MLSQSLDRTMAKAMKYENMTRVVNFGNYFNPDKKRGNITATTEKFVSEIQSSAPKTFDDEILEYIVEDPNCISPVFNFNSYDRTGLPFFKSLGIKLNINSLDEFMEKEETEEEQNLQ